MKKLIFVLLIVSFIVTSNVYANPATNSCGTENTKNSPYPCCDNDLNGSYLNKKDGNCTWWAWKKARDNWKVELNNWNNAYEWDKKAKNDKCEIKDTPQSDVIAQWNKTVKSCVKYKNGKCKEYKDVETGHVAWVHSVDYGKKRAWISEMQCLENKKDGGLNYRYSYYSNEFERYILRNGCKVKKEL